MHAKTYIIQRPKYETTLKTHENTLYRETEYIFRKRVFLSVFELIMYKIAYHQTKHPAYGNERTLREMFMFFFLFFYYFLKYPILKKLL